MVQARQSRRDPENPLLEEDLEKKEEESPGAKHQLRGQQGVNLLRRGLQAQHHPKQVAKPIRLSCVYMQGILKLTMRALNEPVRLGVIGDGLKIINAQQITNRQPQRKLGLPVRSEGRRDINTRNPAVK